MLYKMVKIYLYDSEQSSENIIIPGQYSSGIDFYNNKEGNTVFIETWINTTNTIDSTNNFQSYIDTSTVQIKNLCKLNGTYISTYVYNDNFINEIQKELVVYYIGLTNKYRIKVTYLDNFSKVIIKRVK